MQAEPRVLACRQHDDKLGRPPRQQRSSQPSASAERSSCKSSTTSTTGRSTAARSASSRSTTASPRKLGEGATRSTDAATPASASITDSQKRCASRSPRSTETHPSDSSRPPSSTHERTRTDFPLPAGAHTSATPPEPAADNRSNNTLLWTSPPPTARAPGSDASHQIPQPSSPYERSRRLEEPPVGMISSSAASCTP